MFLSLAKRQHRFPDENVYEVVNKACLARFLPGLARDALEKVMLDIGIQKQDFEENYGKNNNAICQIQSNTLTIGKTSAPIYDPLNKTKIPETLFYNTEQNLNSLEAMLQDYLLGEHLLLIGNQVSLTYVLYFFEYSQINLPNLADIFCLCISPNTYIEICLLPMYIVFFLLSVILQ